MQPTRGQSVQIVVEAYDRRGLLKDLTQVIFSDQPWAVAWYADRMSVWLPPTREGFVAIEEAATDLQTPVAGILISPLSHGSAPISEVANQYKDFTFLILDGRTFFTNYPNGVSLYDRDPKIQDIVKRYPYRRPLYTMDLIYYSDRMISANQEED